MNPWDPKPELRLVNLPVLLVLALVLVLWFMPYYYAVVRFEEACTDDHRDRVACEETAKKIWGVK